MPRKRRRRRERRGTGNSGDRFILYERLNQLVGGLRECLLLRSTYIWEFRTTE